MANRVKDVFLSLYDAILKIICGVVFLLLPKHKVENQADQWINGER